MFPDSIFNRTLPEVMAAATIKKYLLQYGPEQLHVVVPWRALTPLITIFQFQHLLTVCSHR